MYSKADIQTNRDIQRQPERKASRHSHKGRQTAQHTYIQAGRPKIHCQQDRQKYTKRNAARSGTKRLTGRQTDSVTGRHIETHTGRQAI